ncbi:MAG TPA: helix-turn-helix transcriptional regulator [Thermoanaerobaculia bacterium]|jgi:transcriptional regulator with XRE-family HTH domain|nr:helix-turn-helix transcriptional regulator [Thermoanaerobaculia bacterium]
MEKTADHPETPRLLVLFLRQYARKSQVAFGRDAGLRQSDLSRYESGQKIPSEEVLQRMAATAGIPWPLVLHLRRFYNGLLAATARRAAPKEIDELLDFGGAARLAVRSYLMEEAAAEEPPEGL